MNSTNWPTKSLKSLTVRIGDGVHGTPKYSDNGKIPFINGNNLKNGSICILPETKSVDQDEYEKYFIELDKNTLLLSINGTLGSMAKYKGKRVILGKSAAYIKCKNINIDFLYYYLQLPSIQKHMWNVATGSTIKNLSLGSIRDLKVPKPSLDTQKEITGVLSILDAKIDLNNRINAQLEAMAKTLYDYWFVQFDFPISKEQAKAMGKPHLEGKPYKSSGGKMVYDETLKREIPEGWKGGFLDNLGQIVGGSTPSTMVPENFTENGTPWLTPNDLSENIGNKFISKGNIDVSQVGMKSASLKIYPAGTVLMSSRAPIGYMAIARTDVTTNQGFKSFVPNIGYTSEFIYYGIKNALNSIVQNSSGSTFKEVSGMVLKTVKTVLPPIQLSELYSEKAGSIFQKQDCLEFENSELIEHRNWLLPMLMNGHVTVA